MEVGDTGRISETAETTNESERHNEERLLRVKRSEKEHIFALANGLVHRSPRGTRQGKIVLYLSTLRAAKQINVFNPIPDSDAFAGQKLDEYQLCIELFKYELQ